MKKKPNKKKPSKSRITISQAMKLPEAEQRRLIDESEQSPHYLWLVEFFKEEKFLRAQLAGDADDTIERACLELHEETGLNLNELLDLPAREFRRVLSAAIRKRDSRNWIPVSTEHLKGDRSTWLRKAKNPDKSGLRKIRHAEYKARTDKLESLIKPSALNLYRN